MAGSHESGMCQSLFWDEEERLGDYDRYRIAGVLAIYPCRTSRIVLYKGEDTQDNSECIIIQYPRPIFKDLESLSKELKDIHIWGIKNQRNLISHRSTVYVITNWFTTLSNSTLTKARVRHVASRLFCSIEEMHSRGKRLVNITTDNIILQRTVVSIIGKHVTFQGSDASQDAWQTQCADDIRAAGRVVVQLLTGKDIVDKQPESSIEGSDEYSAALRNLLERILCDGGLKPQEVIKDPWFQTKIINRSKL